MKTCRNDQEAIPDRFGSSLMAAYEKCVLLVLMAFRKSALKWEPYIDIVLFVKVFWYVINVLFVANTAVKADDSSMR